MTYTVGIYRATRYQHPVTRAGFIKQQQSRKHEHCRNKKKMRITQGTPNHTSY